MSTLQVANLHLESTGNNRIQLATGNTVAVVAAGANTFVANSTVVNIVAGGANAFVANSTVVNIVAGGVNAITANSTATAITGGLLANGSVGTAGQALFSGGTGANNYWDLPESITLLGTIDTTSGAAGTGKSLTGLTLTNYKQLYITWNDVSISTSDSLRFSDGTSNYTIDTGASFPGVNGILTISLENGIFLFYGFFNNAGTYTSQANLTSTGGGVTGFKVTTGRGRWTTSTTEFNISASGTSNFDGGNVKVYGVA